MGRVVATTSEPALGAIRLAWWREALDRLEPGEAPPAEPTLRAVHQNLVARGITGSDLAMLEDGWVAMFEPFPWTAATAAAIESRGRHLFALAARLLGGDPAAAQIAGAIWALVDAARHCSDPLSRRLLLDLARQSQRDLPRSAPRALRPLTMLAALALRDLRRGEPFEREATPGRAAALFAHRFTGRFRLAD